MILLRRTDFIFAQHLAGLYLQKYCLYISDQLHLGLWESYSHLNKKWRDEYESEVKTHGVFRKRLLWKICLKICGQCRCQGKRTGNSTQFSQAIRPNKHFSLRSVSKIVKKWTIKALTKVKQRAGQQLLKDTNSTKNIFLKCKQQQLQQLGRIS